MWNQWLRFNAVGLVGFAVQLSVLTLLVDSLNFSHPLATFVAVETALLHNFIWHERWTWTAIAKSNYPGTLTRLLRFHAAGAVSITGNVVLTATLVHFAHLPVLVANTLAVGACALINFFLARNFVFFERL